MPQLTRRDIVALVVLVLVGVWWFYIAWTTTIKLHPVHLGLAPLSLLVAGVFVAVRFAKGFNLSTILLLTIPFSICLLLEMTLMASSLAKSVQIELEALRHAAILAISHLVTMFVWIVIFPLGLRWEKLGPERRTLWRRADRVITVFVGMGLLIDISYIMVWIAQVPPAAAIKVVARITQASVLWIHLFLIYKLGLWLVIGRDREPHLLEE